MCLCIIIYVAQLVADCYTIPLTQHEISRLLKDLGSTDLPTQRRAIETLAEHPSDTSAAIAAVRKYAQYSRDGEGLLSFIRYFRGLGDKGKEAIPELVTLVQDSDVNLAAASLRLLSDLQFDDGTNTDRLARMLEQNRIARLSVRWRIPAAIWRMTGGNDRGISLIRRFLSHRDSGVQVAAAGVLWPISTEQQPLSDIFMAAAEDRFFSVRLLLAETIGKLRCTGYEFIPVLRTLATDSESRVREAAIQALSLVDPLGFDITRDLESGLQDEEAFVRGLAARLLRVHFAGVKADPGKLRPLTMDSDSFVRLDAHWGIAVLSPILAERNQSLDQLGFFLFTPNPFVRSAALNAVGELRPARPIPIVCLLYASFAEPVQEIRNKARLQSFLWFWENAATLALTSRRP